MLQEAVVSYITKLEEMKQRVADYPFDSDEFYEGWSKAYDERLVMLKNFCRIIIIDGLMPLMKKSFRKL